MIHAHHLIAHPLSRICTTWTTAVSRMYLLMLPGCRMCPWLVRQQSSLRISLRIISGMISILTLKLSLRLSMSTTTMSHSPRRLFQYWFIPDDAVQDIIYMGYSYHLRLEAGRFLVFLTLLGSTWISRTTDPSSAQAKQTLGWVSSSALTSSLIFISSTISGVSSACSRGAAGLARRRELPLMSRLGSTHSSLPSSSITFSLIISMYSAGTKQSMMKFFSFSSFCRMRLLSCSSSISLAYCSSSSLFSASRFLNRFIFCLIWTTLSSFSSWRFLQILSMVTSDSSFFLMSSSILRWLDRFSSSSSSFRFRSSAFLMAASSSSFPVSTLSSIFFSFLIRFSWFCLYFACSCSFSSIALISPFFSSSRMFFFLYISAFSSSNFRRIFSVSTRSFSSISSTSSSSMTFSMTVGPPPSPMFLATCSFSRLISSWNCRSRASLGSSLMRTSFLMFLALLAYLRVLRVSSQLQSAGPTLAIITVLVLPPSESCSSRVSCESLQGMCFDLESTRLLMTRPRVDSDRFMLIACSLSLPVTPVLSCLSLPAKSTRFSLPALVDSLPFTSSWFSMMMVKIECDRDDSAFIWVRAVVR